MAHLELAACLLRVYGCGMPLAARLVALLLEVLWVGGLASVLFWGLRRRLWPRRGRQTKVVVLAAARARCLFLKRRRVSRPNTR